MAKVTIVIEDVQENGRTLVRVSRVSDPAFPEKPEDSTVAQAYGLYAVAKVKSLMGAVRHKLNQEMPPRLVEEPTNGPA